MKSLERATKIRWNELWRRLGSKIPPMQFEAVASAYGAPGRHYHTLAHIDHCLVELDALNVRPANADLIELALWFHDFSYDTSRKDNEMRSAAFAVREMLLAGISPEQCNHVRALIMATCHKEPPVGYDEKLMVDIDLSVLGSDWGTFVEYEHGVRSEYSSVSDEDFCRGRAAFLRKILERSRIFQTYRFATMYERIAMENLTQSIARLEAGRLP